MVIIRSALWYLLIVVSLIFWFTVLYLAFPFGLNARLAVSRSWSRLAADISRWVCGIRYEMIGLDKLPTLPVIFFSKHQSAWETLVFLGILPKNCFVCKKSLLNIPFFGWGMRLTKHIPIDRKQGMQALKSVIKEGKDRLNLGLSIVIFPEGTRVPPYQNPKFHKSGSALAKATGYPVVPIAHNAGQCWRRNSFLKYPGKITVIVGSPYDTKGKSVDEINDTMYAWIKETMVQLEGQKNHD
jgi:1-acyl-sn-glycerol-3-phosphate acyltransferase